MNNFIKYSIIYVLLLLTCISTEYEQESLQSSSSKIEQDPFLYTLTKNYKCDNYDVNYESALRLYDKIQKANLLDDIEAIVIPGDSGNLVGTILYQKIRQYREKLALKVPVFCIIRSRTNEVLFKSKTYSSVTGGEKKILIREDQEKKLKSLKVFVIDDVISTGGTVKALKNLVEEHCNCHVIGFGCIVLEGDNRISFETKPLFYLINVAYF